jgi:hypothetical protein
MHPTFSPGQRVRTIYGQVGTVRAQGGPNNCMVWLEREPDWWHPSKLFALDRLSARSLDSECKLRRPVMKMLMTNASAVLLLLAGASAAWAEPLPLPKHGQCPSGYSSGASYCTPMPGTRRDAIPKIGQCPPSWISSGGYCLSPERRTH